MAWPEKVPILEPSDICRFLFHAGEKRCIGGWCNETFGEPHHPQYACENPEVRMVRRLFLKAFGVVGDQQQYVAEVNNSYRVTEEKLAETWNQVMKKLGYTVPCER